MITKQALIELVRDRITGEYESKQIGKVGDRKLAYYIGRVYNSLLVGILARNITDAGEYGKEYTDVAIAQDSSTNIYYSTLPSPIISLPRKSGSGVISIDSDTGESVEFVPMSHGNLQVIDGLEVDIVDDVIGYVVRNGRIEYRGMTSTVAAGTLRMLLVIPFEAYDNSDYITIPTGTDEMLVQQVAQFLINKPDADRINDGNSVNKNIRQ